MKLERKRRRKRRRRTCRISGIPRGGRCRLDARLRYQKGERDAETSSQRSLGQPRLSVNYAAPGT
jgi:hypothetical protein